MQFTSLRLKNWRNHKDTTIELEAGINGIIGPNGRGKSNIIEAFRFLLTNDLFQGTKTSAITIGEASGYAIGEFILDGKEGRIERHLDVTKAVLTYDDKTYNKSSEIKEVWEDLLQLNPDIIKNVVIAQQGQIPSLFSGDPSVREKTFQKIFLVPPTEKLRTVIWNNYIKTAPPITGESNVAELVSEKEELESQLKELIKKYEAVDVLPQKEAKACTDRLRLLQEVKRDAGKRVELEEQISGYKVKQTELSKKIDELAKQQDSLDIQAFHNQKATLEAARDNKDQREKLESQLAALEFDEDTFNEQTQILIVNDAVIENLNKDVSVLRAELAAANRELRKYDKFDGVKDCPTCGQPVKDFATILNEIVERVGNFSHQLATKEEELKQVVELRNATNNYLKEAQKTRNDIERIAFALKTLPQIPFSQKEYEIITRAIDFYTKCENDLQLLKAEAAALENQETKATTELELLRVYEGRDLETEEKELTELLSQHEQNTEERRKLQEDIAIHNDRIARNETEIVKAEEAIKKNERIKNYVDTLQSVYDVLHSTKFPRTLILSYADTVADKLNEYLRHFDIPYTATIGEGFKIECINKEGQTLPTVSGGQEVLVGLSLRFGLHDLFSQSFPIMVIDEGSTHLDEYNRKMYFNILNKIREENKQKKQIIIIDHDTALTDVVDNVIDITEINK